MTFYQLEQQVYLIQNGDAFPFLVTKRTAITDLDTGDREIFYNLEKSDDATVTINNISEKDLKQAHHEAVDFVIYKNFSRKE